MAEPVLHEAITLDEFERLYASRGYEYVDGRALPRGPETVSEDGTTTVEARNLDLRFLETRVGYAVGKYILDHKLGVPLPNGVGFFMTKDPPEIRDCHFAFLSPERARQCTLGEWLPFPPDFAIEVVSEWDSADYIQRKSHGYMANGCRLLWVIYPAAKQVAVHWPDHPVQLHMDRDVLNGGDVLPGFQRTVAELLNATPDTDQS